MSVEVRKFNHISKGYLIGFADITLTNISLEIDGCGYFKKDARTWLSMPSKEFTDKEGQKKYKTLIRFSDKEKNDKFLDIAKKAVEDYMKTCPAQADMFVENNKPGEVPF